MPWPVAFLPSSPGRTWPGEEGKITVIHVRTGFRKHKHAGRNAGAGKTVAARPRTPPTAAPRGHHDRGAG
ncbi:hypothetical protein [Lentzea xinjiangensis]|uniref:hypothetical protein n=1 Tax=Lentzea xinjiangensis TaxID=402600 RepID=UPI001160A9C6|nr:hypothetical protein [Lentzea xinjiangensis]